MPDNLFFLLGTGRLLPERSRPSVYCWKKKPSKQNNKNPPERGGGWTRFLFLEILEGLP